MPRSIRWRLWDRMARFRMALWVAVEQAGVEHHLLPTFVGAGAREVRVHA